MGKESIVEIPSGSGNRYRYVYDQGSTNYLGPVGSAPDLGEEEFMMLVGDNRRLTIITEAGVRFETGLPVMFPYLRNKEKAPYLGERFDQHIEPTGRYLIHDTARRKPSETWEQGVIQFDNPLVIEWVGTQGEDGWKQRLSRFYDATGVVLTDRIMDDGFDAIVTVEEHKSTRSTSEIVQLR